MTSASALANTDAPHGWPYVWPYAWLRRGGGQLRPHCYKLTLLALVLLFLLMQYAVTFVVHKHKFSVSQSMPLSVLHWMSGADHSAPLKSANANHSAVDSPLVSRLKLLAANRSADDVRQTVNGVNSNTETILELSASYFDNQFNDSIVTTSSLQLCPLVPPTLVGRLKVMDDSPSFEKLEALFPELEPGGRYQPKDCLARHKVAIIIPYRDREEHLRMFLHNMHPILIRQQLDYGIYIVEEVGNGKFNRAKLMNIGFIESLKQYDYQCFIFHDVDLIPEDDRNLYTCPEQPRHMSVAIDKFSYRLPYNDLFGGVSALSKAQFEKINGFSNEFWGWGGEDDDMSNRIRHYGYKISRYPADIARYKMLKHKGDEPNPDRYRKLYSGSRRYKTDGINSVTYKRVDLIFKKLYTWVLVDVIGP